MNKDATMNAAAGAYEGLDRYACREKLWEDMSAMDLTLKVEPHMQRVPRSERSGEVIEPMISSQWFVKMDTMAQKGCDAVRSGDITILPERFEKVYFNWLENIQDWCVSRQLWWGHRIPVWYADGHDKVYVARSAEEAQAQADAELGPGVTLRQDEDVLDTWFSSGLWPLATVGCPSSDPAALSEFNRFYPSAVMETGYDILFFWVARMIMMGLEFTDEVPFDTIYMHGLVRDEKNEKMSKTKGNVVDPLDVVDEYGADALRFSLVTGVTPGQDVPLSMERVKVNRNFCNKLWNAARFLEPKMVTSGGIITQEELASMPLFERYIVSEAHACAEASAAALEDYSIGDAGTRAYRFFYDEFADWYVEVSKTRSEE